MSSQDESKRGALTPYNRSGGHTKIENSRKKVGYILTFDIEIRINIYFLDC